MQLRLRRNIVIKAGTVFDTAAAHVDRDAEHVEAIFGMSKNTYGSIVYDVAKEYRKEWRKFFEPIEEKSARTVRRKTARPTKRSPAIAALKNLYEACMYVDEIGELHSRIGGELLDAARDVLQRAGVR